MPTYEYECQRCGKVFDRFQKMNEESLSSCIDKRCNGKVRRLIGRGAGFIFKGSGFYATDYRSENYKKGETKEMPKAESPCQSCDKKEGCEQSE